MSALAVQSAVAGYGAAEMILKGASIRVLPGEIVCLIGPNGAGKSTLMKAIAGLLQLSSGSIRLGERDLTGTPPLTRVRAGIGLVPQERNIFQNLTVLENLLTGAAGAADARRKAGEMMARFPVLAEKRGQPAGSLSGGQRQLLAMAAGLMSGPNLLLLDEPTAGLSPRAADEVFDIVRQLPEAGVSVLMVEQNALDALLVSTRGYVLVSGQVAREGGGPALAADPEIRRLFLGG
jgi:branched-chain amino acid transport system ATP-binding protein/neutral amino acid transport system ATP-binding protein